MVDRRSVLKGALLAPVSIALGGRIGSAQEADAFSYPMALPGRPMGDGFFIRHTFTSENTWYLPNYWHTGEDWYLIDGDTAGAAVCSIADGEVVYVGGNYPGLVVIVEHPGDIFSMYSHISFDGAISEGESVSRGQPVGTVLQRGDWVPNHMHFEVRTFLTASEVNGASPRYGFACGPDCPPGPGYWPMDAPDLPTEVGWLNPTHVIAGQAGRPGGGPAELVVPVIPARDIVPVWETPSDADSAAQVGELRLDPGARFTFEEVLTGSKTPAESSAQAYTLWYRLTAPDGVAGWVRGAIADTFETGADGRASTLRFNLLPAFTMADQGLAKEGD